MTYLFVLPNESVLGMHPKRSINRVAHMQVKDNIVGLVDRQAFFGLVSVETFPIDY